MKLKVFLDNLFIMTKAERNGSFVLLGILFVLIIIRIASPYFVKEDTCYYEEIERKIAILKAQKDSLEKFEVEKNMSQVKSFSENKYYSSEKTVEADKKENYFNFDPNTVNYSQLLSLGFSQNTATTLIKFRSKGGKFYKPEDILKVYGMDSMLYEKLLIYIKISLPEQNTYQVENIFKTRKPVLIEINSADSAEWLALSGIGPVYACLICKFRKILGGFVSIEQIKEVYKLPEETYEKIYSNLKIDTTLVKRININFADIDDLRNHPYCNYSTGRRIIDYRAKHGSFNSINQLLTDSVLSINEFKRLTPYFTLTN